MAIKQTEIKASDLVQQRKTLYRALSENVQAVIFFFCGVALFTFAVSLGWWARGDIQTQKDVTEFKSILSVTNIYMAQSKAKINILEQRIKELEK